MNGRAAGTKRQISRASEVPTILCRPGAEDPFGPRHRAFLVALAEVVVAGHIDDVGDEDQAADYRQDDPGAMLSAIQSCRVRFERPALRRGLVSPVS